MPFTPPLVREASSRGRVHPHAPAAAWSQGHQHDGGVCARSQPGRARGEERGSSTSLACYHPRHRRLAAEPAWLCVTLAATIGFVSVGDARSQASELDRTDRVVVASTIYSLI